MTGPKSDRLIALMQAAAQARDDRSAEALFLQIVGLNPRDADAWHMLAAIAIRDGRPAHAVDCAERAHRLDRRNPEYLNTLGVAQGELRRLDEAVRYFQRAVKERPDYVEAHYNLGKAFAKIGRYDEAERSYRRALGLAPDRLDVVANLGTLLCRLGDADEGLALLEKASTASPDDRFGTHRNFALSLLLHHRLERGWQEYLHWRRLPTAPPPSPVADRLPEPLAGGQIVLIPEQGIGDVLFFLRFVPELRRQGAHAGLIAPPKLMELLRPSPLLEFIVNSAADLPERFGRAVPILVGSLPGLLGCAQAPAPFPIDVPSQRTEAWKQRLAQSAPPPYLAITWRAGRKPESASEFLLDEPALHKEIDVEKLAASLKRWHGSVLVVQRSPAPDEMAKFTRALGRNVADLSMLNDALEEMAALLSVVDEYVGVSNTNMHIMAGLGKRAHVLIPFPPEFRWLQQGDCSPWFPGFQTYRQRPNGDWSTALCRLQSELTP